MIRSLLTLLLYLLLCPLSYAENTDVSPIKAGPEKQQFSSVEERRLLLALQQERQNLIKEQESIKNRKKELKRIEDEVDKKLDQLEAARLQLKELLAEKDARELKRIRDLSKMYGKMSPEKAARIFGTLEQKLAIAILADMKTKAAAKLLNNMDRDKAAKLTTAFSSLE